MSHPYEGERRMFRLPTALARGFDDYARHDGQVVTIERSYEMPRGEASPQAFYVRAADGWLGAAFANELEEIAR
jgi:hypothetical protein